MTSLFAVYSLCWYDEHSLIWFDPTADRGLGALERAPLNNQTGTMSSVGYLILWYLNVLGAWAINVDTKEPIIRGLPDQYASEAQDFGYQTVLHMLPVPDPVTDIQGFVSKAR